MFNFTLSRDSLRAMAQRASSEYIINGTPLTEAVIKVASSCPHTLTAEHVRRICEMTYHDAYERLHKTASGADRYVSFDPPDAVVAAKKLRATKTAAAERSANLFEGTAVMTSKVASLRTKFTPANAFTELVKAAEAPEVNWENPNKEIQDIQTSLKEAKSSLHVELGGVKTAHAVATGELIESMIGMYKQGNSIPDLLHACLSQLDWNEITKESAQETSNIIAEKIASAVNTVVGMPVNEVAHLGDVNPEHPLPKKFSKVAELATQRAHLEFALDEIDSNVEYFNRKLEDLLK